MSAFALPSLCCQRASSRHSFALRASPFLSTRIDYFRPRRKLREIDHGIASRLVSSPVLIGKFAKTAETSYRFAAERFKTQRVASFLSFSLTLFLVFFLSLFFFLLFRRGLSRSLWCVPFPRRLLRNFILVFFLPFLSIRRGGSVFKYSKGFVVVGGRNIGEKVARNIKENGTTFSSRLNVSPSTPKEIYYL